MCCHNSVPKKNTNTQRASKLDKKKKNREIIEKTKGFERKKVYDPSGNNCKKEKNLDTFFKKSEGLVQSKPNLNPGSGINGLAHIKTDQSPLQKSKERQIRPDSGTNSRGPGANLRTA